ncbi:MAG: 4Fe-4S dicluster domain-containing protein [Chloroflexi bacterium]|nr:4Fe-4S dicluster domain-containing protein [Chloroflexota bacterium]
MTLRTARRRPVTAQYPEPDKRQPVQDRFMGFPALTWDYEVVEPYCTGCMVCIRECPTQCMSAQMKDNPKAAEGTSSRRKIIETFEINLGRCILCGICVDVCNFDAIEMSHEHELSKYERNGNRADLDRLLELGREYQDEVSWKPTQPEKNSGVPKPGAKRPAAAKPAVADAEGKPSSEMTKEDRLAAARARAAAKKQAQASDDAVAEAPPDATPMAKSDMTPEDRVAAARARAAAKKQAQASSEVDANAEENPKKEGVTD